ncbi:MAG: cytochrome c3 family protein [Spirochaetota bacterium]|nr:cytochrome c3 family protein [Spirochaetota bacterium]
MKKYKYYFTSILIITTAVFTFSVRGVNSEAGRDEGRICYQCHPEVKKAVFSQSAHLPAKKGDCVKCHNPHTSNYDNFLLEEGGNLCFQCHQEKRKEFHTSYMHLPVSKGECVKCHNPHASKNQKLLSTGSNDICFQCHKKEKIFSRKNIHEPLNEGNCLECHNPHASEEEFLLVRNSRAICQDCHSSGDEDLRKAHRDSISDDTNCLGCHNPHSSNHDALGREFSHKPFDDNDCEDCHTSNGNRITMTMNKNGKALCFDCHEEMEKKFQKVYSHLQGYRDNACLECHNPHASDDKGLKRARDEKICYSCHADTKRRVKGNDPMYKYKHPDIERCTSCHNPHGSNYRLLLKSDENASCEVCHETQGKFTHPVGAKVIDPRSKRDVNCVTCHNPMGSEDEYCVRFGRKKKLCIQCHRYR